MRGESWEKTSHKRTVSRSAQILVEGQQLAQLIRIVHIFASRNFVRDLLALAESSLAVRLFGNPLAHREN